MLFAAVILILCASSSDGQGLRSQPSTLTTVPANHLLAAEDTSVTANCIASGSPLPQDLRWYDDDPYNQHEPIPESGRDGVHVEWANPGRKDVLTLFITRVEYDHQGIYTCKASASDTPIEVKLNVTVYQDIVIWADVLQYLWIYSDGLVKCKVTGNPAPTVKWFKGSENINSGGRYIIQDDGLLILNVSEADTDVYTCRASVAITGKVESVDIYVEVAIPPKITMPPQDTMGVELFDAHFECFASGRPTPQYLWYKSNQPLTDQEKFPISPSGTKLTVKNIDKHDESDYKCLARIQAGSVSDYKDDSAVAKLDVILPPKVRDNRNKTEVDENSEVYINCTISGEPLPVIEWHKAGRDAPYVDGTQPDDSRIRIQWENGSLWTDARIPSIISRLRIYPTISSDRGWYRCTGKNAANDILEEHELNRIYPPYYRDNELVIYFKPNIIDTITKYYSWIDYTVNISCFAEGEPKPSIEWWFNEKPVVLDGIYYRQFGSGPLSFLQVQTRNPSEFGWYECRATNLKDSVYLNIELIQAYAPVDPPEVKFPLVTPTAVTFEIKEPKYDGGLPINGYEIKYRNALDDSQIFREVIFPADGPYVLGYLSPEAQYTVMVAGMNRVGVGAPTNQMSIYTPRMREPYAPEIVEDELVLYIDQYLLLWKEPNSGGRPIDHYEIIYEPIQYTDTQKKSGSWTALEPRVTVAIRAPAMNYMIKYLFSDQTYRVELRARNSIGTSPPAQHFFETLPGDNPYSEPIRPELSSGGVMGIVIICVIVLLIIIDICCCIFGDAGCTFYICATCCDREKKEKEVLKTRPEITIVKREASDEVSDEFSDEEETEEFDDDAKPRSSVENGSDYPTMKLRDAHSRESYDSDVKKDPDFYGEDDDIGSSRDLQLKMAADDDSEVVGYPYHRSHEDIDERLAYKPKNLGSTEFDESHSQPPVIPPMAAYAHGFEDKPASYHGSRDLHQAEGFRGPYGSDELRLDEGSASRDFSTPPPRPPKPKKHRSRELPDESSMSYVSSEFSHEPRRIGQPRPHGSQEWQQQPARPAPRPPRPPPMPPTVQQHPDYEYDQEYRPWRSQEGGFNESSV